MNRTHGKMEERNQNRFYCRTEQRTGNIEFEYIKSAAAAGKIWIDHEPDIQPTMTII